MNFWLKCSLLLISYFALLFSFSLFHPYLPPPVLTMMWCCMKGNVLLCMVDEKLCYLLLSEMRNMNNRLLSRSWSTRVLGVDGSLLFFLQICSCPKYTDMFVFNPSKLFIYLSVLTNTHRGTSYIFTSHLRPS